MRNTSSAQRFWLSFGLSLSTSIPFAGMLGIVTTTALVTAVSPASAAQLQHWQYDPATHRLQITVPGGTKPRYFLVAEPARIVVDLPDTQVGSVPLQQTYSGAVRSIRISQFQPTLARIVIELAPDAVLARQQVELQAVSGTTGSKDERWAIRPLLSSDAVATASMPAPASAASPPPRPAAAAATHQPAPDPSNTAGLPPIEPGATQIPVEMPVATANPPATTPAPAASAPPAPTSDAAAPAATPPTAPAGQAAAPASPMTAQQPGTPRRDRTAVADASGTPESLPEPAPTLSASASTPGSPPPQANAAPPAAPASGEPDRSALPTAPPAAPGVTVTVPPVPSVTASAPAASAAPAPTSSRDQSANRSVEQRNAEQRNSERPNSRTASGADSFPTPSGLAAASATPAMPDPAPAASVPAGSAPVAAPTVSVPAAPAPASPAPAAPAPAAPAPATPTATVTQAEQPTLIATVDFGQPIPRSSFNGSPSVQPEQAYPSSPMAPTPVAVNSSSPILLPAGTVLSLRYPGSAPLELKSEQPRQEVLVLAQAVRDSSGQVVLPEGTPVIGRFETQNGSSLFITQAISLQNGNLPLNAKSEPLGGGRHVSQHRLVRNSALGAAGGTILGAITGIGLIPALLAGAAGSAATTYATAPQAPVIHPDQVIEVQVQ